ncbi:MAG TPA: SusC/RagA family TonB-linked outer membrane protein [Puia sp.]|uniref:SusC/RagA family TonB-linked outer membrane protein n=1 Tax=Puia sp. TaxID=2045100 RepID=UPI002B7D9D06|nr:SusC/RagA family TonB-linked outer membrane protein [Puia sp.]HVU93810.1 SusC/RagA family TonB-linked outer membrane protein [Puia sp.]
MRKLITLLAVLIVTELSALAQTRIPVKGRVLDDVGQPVSFATIRVKGQKQGTSADADGYFTIKVLKGATILVNAVGYEEMELPADGDLSFRLKRTNKALSEVVVSTAFGVRKSERTTPYSAQVVKAEAINMIPQTNLADALAGKVAGVQFRSQSPSKLNSQAFARIRGGLMLSGDVSPIYVVDGTIIENDGSRDGSYDIDPANIESVTVLKGANATALFGGKAVNGAIVITTKKGSSGRSSVQVTQGLIADKVTHLLHLQNRYAGGANNYLTTYHWKAGDPEEWKTLEGVGFPDYTDDSSWGPEMTGQTYAPWYAWVPGTAYTGKSAKLVAQPGNVKDFWETGLTSNTNVSFTKGGQGYTTRLSYSKQYIGGIIPDSKSDRNIITSSTTIELNKYVSAGVDLTYNTQLLTGEYNDGYANQTSGNFGQWNHRDLDMKLVKQLRTLKTPIGTLASWNWFHNPDGYDASNPSSFFTGNYWYNFYGYQDNLNYQTRRDRIFGDAYIKLNLFNGFSVKGTVRKDQYNYWFENKTASILEKSGSQTGLLAAYSTGQRYQNELNYELIANYNQTLFKDLSINILGGANVNTYTRKDLSSNTNQGLNIPDFYDISNSKAQPSVGSSRLDSKTNSLFASGEFEYKRFLSLTGMVRQDWSSTLPSSANKLLYPAAGFSFVPTELIKKLPAWLSFGKLYGSWGRKPLTLDIYANNFPYSVDQYQWNGNFLMSSPGVVPDPRLKGALITSYEAGIDMRFVNNRFGLTVNYYNETSANQPVTINVDAVSGYTSKTINAATVQRKGFEFTATAGIMRSKDFSWNVTATLGWLLKNPVTQIVQGQKRIQPSGWIGTFGTHYASSYQVLNQDWGQLIGGGYTRGAGNLPEIDPTTGLYITGDPNKNWGSIVPKVTGGFQNLFTYKDFIVNASLDYQFGGKFFSLTESWSMYSGDIDYTAANNDRGKSVRDPVANGGGVHVKGVSSVDQKTPIDMYVDGFTYFHQFYGAQIAEPFVHSLSFVKLREVSVGYNLPVKKWGLTGKFMQGATASVVARNLWLIYSGSRNFDPSEISAVYGENGQLPATRSLGVNLSFTF